jgi:hypothetical protein
MSHLLIHKDVNDTEVQNYVQNHNGTYMERFDLGPAYNQWRVFVRIDKDEDLGYTGSTIH